MKEIKKHYVRTNCLKQSFQHLNPDYAHVLEFGVAKGVTLATIAKYLRKDYEIFGFDSFIGLPEACLVRF